MLQRFLIGRLAFNGYILRLPVFLHQAASQIVRAYFGGMVWITAELALLMTLTPPCPPPGLIQRIVVRDNSVYARAIFSPDEYHPTLDFQSEDNSQTWQILDHVSSDIAQELEQKVILPKTVCDPANSQLCYRIMGKEAVQESVNGGNSWHVAWSLPAGRRKYMERVVYCAQSIDLGPYDLAPINRDGRGELIVAMGSEGVLVRTPAGIWERYAVLPQYGLDPTPYAAENISRAITVMWTEASIWLFTGLFTLLYLWRRSMNAILAGTKGSSKSERSERWATRPAYLLGAALISLCLLVYTMLSFRAGVFMMIDTPLEVMLAGLVVILPILSFILTWRRMAQIAYRPRLAWMAAGICALTAIAIFPLTWLPFLLWALGIISYYEIALVLSIASAILILWWGIRQADQASQIASTSAIGDPSG